MFTSYAADPLRAVISIEYVFDFASTENCIQILFLMSEDELVELEKVVASAQSSCKTDVTRIKKLFPVPKEAKPAQGATVG